MLRLTEGGGTGITTMPVLQSLSQARDRWGDHAEGAIWDASIHEAPASSVETERQLLLLVREDPCHRSAPWSSDYEVSQDRCAHRLIPPCRH